MGRERLLKARDVCQTQRDHDGDNDGENSDHEEMKRCCAESCNAEKLRLEQQCVRSIRRLTEASQTLEVAGRLSVDVSKAVCERTRLEQERKSLDSRKGDLTEKCEEALRGCEGSLKDLEQLRLERNLSSEILRGKSEEKKREDVARRRQEEVDAKRHKATEDARVNACCEEIT